MRKPFAPFLAGALLLGAVGCAPKYVLKANEAESPVLSGDCQLQIFEKAPAQAYSVLGTIEPENPAKLAKNEQDFLSSVRESACKHAADAVIADRNAEGLFTRGVLIRLR